MVVFATLEASVPRALANYVMKGRSKRTVAGVSDTYCVPAWSAVPLSEETECHRELVHVLKGSPHGSNVLPKDA